jgi:hypothetical protein
MRDLLVNAWRRAAEPADPSDKDCAAGEALQRKLLHAAPTLRTRLR